jgi:hypothetical protein
MNIYGFPGFYSAHDLRTLRLYSISHFPFFRRKCLVLEVRRGTCAQQNISLAPFPRPTCPSWDFKNMEIVHTCCYLREEDRWSDEGMILYLKGTFNEILLNDGGPRVKPGDVISF